MNINNFENPKDIIDRETLVDAEKIAPADTVYTLKEKINQTKESLKSLRKSELVLSNKIIDLIAGLDDFSNYTKNVLEITKLQDNLATVKFNIDKELDSLKNFNVFNNKLQEFDGLERKN